MEQLVGGDVAADAVAADAGIATGEALAMRSEPLVLV